MTELDELLELREVAAELGISVRAVQYRIERGQLAAQRFGSGRTAPFYVTRAELERVKAADSAAS